MSRSARRITAAVLAAGALVAAAALPAVADDHDHGRGHDRGHSQDRGHDRDHGEGRDRGHAQRSAVVLGKIQYNSPGRDNGSTRSLNGEWVTVTNTGRHAVNLRGWTLRDESRRTYRFDL